MKMIVAIYSIAQKWLQIMITQIYSHKWIAPRANYTRNPLFLFYILNAANVALRKCRTQKKSRKIFRVLGDTFFRTTFCFLSFCNF